jgi:hypothetical protein
MPLQETAAVADKVISYAGAAGKASKLNYDVELPGALRGRRLVELRGLVADDKWKTASGGKAAAVTPIASQIDLAAVASSSGTYTYDEGKATEFWFATALANGVDPAEIQALQLYLASPPQAALIAEGVHPVRRASGSRTLLGAEGPGGVDGDPSLPEKPAALDAYIAFKEALESGKVLLPFGDVVGKLQLHKYDAVAPADPGPSPENHLCIVEVYQVSSFYGDYGLGRTVKTMTLFPGEEMTIRTRTWRSSEKSVKDSSTVFDSASTESKARFSQQVRNETTSKDVQSKTEEWHVDAKVGVGWGWGSAEVSGGGSGEYHSARESFASGVNDATKEHAENASSNRETTVSSSTESTDRIENEESTERVIRNANLRRTLSFVFRELHQTYEVYTHLIDIRIGYSDGTPNSWREVPLSGLRRLLSDVLVAAEVDGVATKLLDVIDPVFDLDDSPNPVLASTVWDSIKRDWVKTNPAAPTSDGAKPPVWPAPDDTRFYRFRSGEPIGQTGPGALSHKVDGVLIKHDTVTLRTDSVLVEALLGGADALDDYALSSQKADADAKTLANERARTLNEALSGIVDFDKRLEHGAALTFGDQPLRLQILGGP